MEALLYVCVAFMPCGYAAGRECTNSPTHSHALQYELGTSKNETWEKEVMSHYHVTPTEDSAWTDLLPRELSTEEHQHNWTDIKRLIKAGSPSVPAALMYCSTSAPLLLCSHPEYEGQPWVTKEESHVRLTLRRWT
ncbi:hypothetical protein KIW84_065076 [Lathyrus oleraceus]|uniref:Uncharacterized protein n=1 Tax=Pisum sativum TaxID=3888 RepID=A0A9D4WDI2_PEA|nr:hypothetical protein KIW84_065076 [Pisum sativum]